MKNKMRPKYKAPRVIQSSNIVELRKNEAQIYSNELKSDLFNKRILENTLYKGLIPRRLNPELPLWDTEHSTYNLLIASYKHAVEESDQSLNNLEDVVDSMGFLDDIMGGKGHLPKAVYPKDKNILPFEEPIDSTNVYTQAIFSYLVAWRVSENPQLNEKIRGNARRLLNAFLDCDFDLNSGGIKVAKRGSLYVPPYLPDDSRRLDSLFLEEAGRMILGDDEIVRGFEKFNDQHNYWGKNYRVSFKLGCFEWPTYSTHWLNFLRLSVLKDSPKGNFSRLFETHFQDHVLDNNPFFNSIYSIFSKPSEETVKKLISNSNEILSTYPVTLNDAEIVNSPVFGRDTRWRFVKPSYKRVLGKDYSPESMTPLPFYMRPLSDVQFKQNPFILDGNFNRKGNQSFLGTDYLMAYWMNRFVEKSLNEGAYSQ